MAWDASSDNVAVAGYDVSLNGNGVNSVSQTSYRFTGLSCGTSYTLGVAAFDAAGNRSTVSTLTTATAARPDTTPPSAPSNLQVSASDQSSLTLAWDASSDNVAVAGYDVSLNGSGVNSVSQTSYRFTGLTCGTSYTLGVAAFDVAGNGSTVSTLTTATAPCPTGPLNPCSTVVNPPATYQHVVWIVFENKPDSAIIGSASAPYTNTLASQCGVATNFFAETHPSLPNYIAMTSGSTEGITNVCGSVATSVASPFDLLPSAELAVAPGIHAVELRPDRLLSVCGQAQPGRVLHGHQDGLRIARRTAWLDAGYQRRHSECSATSNLRQRLHDCSVSTGDSWLSTLLPAASLAPCAKRSGSTAIFITWDEDDSSASNHIATLSNRSLRTGRHEGSDDVQPLLHAAHNRGVARPQHLSRRCRDRDEHAQSIPLLGHDAFRNQRFHCSRNRLARSPLFEHPTKTRLRAKPPPHTRPRRQGRLAQNSS